jgi:hypothetical protein
MNAKAKGSGKSPKGSVAAASSKKPSSGAAKKPSKHELKAQANEALRSATRGALERAKAAGNYPMTLASLVGGAQLSAAQVKQLAKAPGDFECALSLPNAKVPSDQEQVWAVLPGDAFLLAQEPRLLVALIGTVRSKKDHAVALAALIKKLPKPLHGAFEEHWSLALGTRSLPEGVGALKLGGQHKLFLLADIVGVPSVPAGASDHKTRSGAAAASRNGHHVDPMQTQPSSFAVSNAVDPDLKARLLAAFDRLREQSDMGSYVSLRDLRTELPDTSRERFDEALNDLRRDWVFTLSPAEGRHETVPKDILDAGITEQSRLLVYVARRDT